MDDMVMIKSMNTLQSMDLYRRNSDEDDNSEASSVNSDDSSIAVLYKNGEPPFFSENNYPSLSTVCSQEGSPLEQREDIIETKSIPGRLKDVLNFNDEVKLREVEEQMKARENIDQDMENEIQNIKNMEANKQFEDTMLLEAARIACEKAIQVREVAKNGRTTLKRAMEIMEVAFPPFITACEKSYERNDLSDGVEKESQQYEMCLLEKRKAALDFELGQKKTIEAYHHLDQCIQIAKKDETRMAEKKVDEIQQGRVRIFTDAKKEMDDIIKSELAEVHSCLMYCKGDLENIGTIRGEQEKRFNASSKTYEKNEKTLDTKLCVNRKNQEDLRAQLANLEKQERALVERRKFEQQVQSRAKEWNDKVSEQLTELGKSIKNIQSCATTSLKVMELMKEGGSRLLGAAIIAEEQYLTHLKELDIEAKTKWRNALAASAVEKRLNIDFATTNIDEYKEKYKDMKQELKKAVQSQMRLNAERLKAEMKDYKEEIKQEEKKKKQAEEELNVLMETIIQCDEQLCNLGRKVDSVDILYQWRKRELEDANANDMSSIEFTEDEDSDDDI